MCPCRASEARPSPTRMASTAVMLLGTRWGCVGGGDATAAVPALRRVGVVVRPKSSPPVSRNCARLCRGRVRLRLSPWLSPLHCRLGGGRLVSAARVTVPLRLKFWSSSRTDRISRRRVARRRALPGKRRHRGKLKHPGQQYITPSVKPPSSAPALRVICANFPRRHRRMPAVRASFKHSVDEPTQNRPA